MARNWFPVRYDLKQDPAVVKMEIHLKPKPRTSRDRAAKLQRICGCLAEIWQLFDSETADGLLPNYNKRMLDLAVFWPGFGDAMEAAGWLEETPQGLIMPGFTTWLGKGAKVRLKDAYRKANVRKNSDKMRTTVQDRTEETPKGVSSGLSAGGRNSKGASKVPPSTESAYPREGGRRSVSATDIYCSDEEVQAAIAKIEQLAKGNGHAQVKKST